MPNTNPTYPSNKKNWDIAEKEAGSVGSTDNAALEVTRRVGTDGVEFGVFINVDSVTGLVDKVAAGDALVHGVALIDNLAQDYENRQYKIDDKAAVARRGYFMVKIDVNNKPVVGGVVRISSAASLEGYLTTNAVGSKIAAEGIAIEAVFDTVAEVYLEGKAAIAVA